jgi:hypothetical protein
VINSLSLSFFFSNHGLVLRLNEGCKGSPEGVSVDGKSVYLLPIAPAEGCKEVGQLETRRDRVLEGMQDGARRVFEVRHDGYDHGHDAVGDLLVLPVLILIIASFCCQNCNILTTVCSHMSICTLYARLLIDQSPLLVAICFLIASSTLTYWYNHCRTFFF